MVKEQRENGAIARCNREPLIESPLSIQLIYGRKGLWTLLRPLRNVLVIVAESVEVAGNFSSSN